MTESIDHLRETIAALMRWIAAERLDATVIGGVAAGLQGQPRLTEDVDVVVFDAQAETLIASGKRHGFEPRVADAIEFSRRTRVLLMQHRSGVDVDLSLGALPFEREVIERAQSIDIGGLRISIATPEDLIVMKALARRPQDIADIAGIIEVQPDLDVDRIRHWVREFSAVLEMPEILDDLELLLRRRTR
jgi:predicted nucleotidyltransferase